MVRRLLAKLCLLSILPFTVLLSQAVHPKGDGMGDDTASIQQALDAAAKSCGTVVLECSAANQFKVSKTIRVPKCVKFVGACGGVSGEATPNTEGTTLKWAGGEAAPVVSFHGASGASLTGISVDCQNVPNTIGVQYDSDDKPPASFVNIENLMIKGCHQGVVLGLPDAAARHDARECAANPLQPGCYQSDQFKLERYRIQGNPSDQTGEGIHINSSNAAQGSLIANGNIQSVEIAIRIIMNNGGLVIQGTNTGSPAGPNPIFLQIESTVAVSPTLINDEVEGEVRGKTFTAIADHSCNPFHVPGNPVWLYNAWNNHPIVVDGCENVTSIANLLNKSAVTSNAAHILSLNETGWSIGGAATPANLTVISPAEAIFGGLLKIQSGLHPDGSGLKHQTVSTGNIPAGAQTKIVLKWTSAFADTNYQPLCSIEESTGSLQVLSSAPPTAAEVATFVKNNDASHAHAGMLACLAIHN